MVRKLIECGADINASSAEGTPLHFAAKNEHFSIMRALITGGANPDALDKHGETPLHHAAKKGHLEVMRALITGGANPDALDKHGETPFQLAEANGFLYVTLS